MGQQNTLFDDIMQGRWERVVTAYANLETQKSKITTSEDTALHIAVLNGQTEVMRQLVKQIQSKYAAEVLGLQNAAGSTAIHLAAAVGDADMCKCLASKASAELIGISNRDGETPLFMAAISGKTQNFFILLDSLDKEEADEICHWRSCRGDTILHAAISGEHFELAYHIIEQWPDLVNKIREDGASPLHILAGKPNAFRSNSHFGLFDRIIYSCAIVDDLDQTRSSSGLEKSERSHNYPESYETCMTFFHLMKKLLIFCSFRQSQDCVSEESSDDPESFSKGSIPGAESIRTGKLKEIFPPNYATSIDIFKLILKALLIILGLGYSRVAKITRMKVAHTWANVVLKALVDKTSTYRYEDSGRKPIDGDIDLGQIAELQTDDQISQSSVNNTNVPETGDKKEKSIIVAAHLGITDLVEHFMKAWPATIRELDTENKYLVLVSHEKENRTHFGSMSKETPILIAAKMGVKEVVQKIMETFPIAIHDLDSDNKNVVLLAVENKHVQVFKMLKEKTLARSRSWPANAVGTQVVQVRYAVNATQLLSSIQQERKQILLKTHKQLAKTGSEWLSKTSESCSVVAALVATVAFAGSSTVPGGNKEDTGIPVLEREPAFNVFAIASLLALCLSVTSLVTFLTILTSRFDHKDFAKTLPRKLIWGLTSLFLSIASMLVSFCAAHFFVLNESLRMFSYPAYAASCLPVTIFLLSTFSLYYDLVWAIYLEEPQHSFTEFHA
ncbi:unnamed protein product [Linum trigynum]|uniref:PGG domain-containing protein n=1 Tax=Linum trigynum TaxID=586398 RepID=A0AAV2CCL1_9ROSI